MAVPAPHPRRAPTPPGKKDPSSCEPLVRTRRSYCRHLGDRVFLVIYSFRSDILHPESSPCGFNLLDTSNYKSKMNQQCKVCGEPAAGFHFGAFTCEGCKSFFGRSYNNLSSISECKNNGECVINKKNRTSCKACRLRKCLLVGMSKSGSRYGRRSNWFKIHCLLQEQKQKNDDGRHGSQIASINRNQEELMLLGLEDYKTYSPSTSSPGSDTSEEKCRREPPYFGFPIIPQMFLPQPFHPAFFPSPYLYQNRTWDESPIDLSTKSAEDSTDSDEDINVDDLPEEPSIIRAPLDLTTKVV